MTLREHAAALHETIRSMLGSHDADQVKEALERELRHMVPTWTEEKPTCPGWYWFKPPDISDPRLILVDHGRIDTKLMADLGPPHNLVDVQRIKGHWAGPLLPPS